MLMKVNIKHYLDAIIMRLDWIDNKGKFYDNYLIPFNFFSERFVKLSISLSIKGILEKSQIPPIL